MKLLNKLEERKIGIYKITNLINNKFYIGSTTISFIKRFTTHLHNLRNNKHHSTYLQNSWNKYKEENFVFEILEICNKEICIEKEQYYIDNLKPEYNMNPFAKNCKGRILTQFTKDKISKKLKGVKTGNRISKEDRQRFAFFRKRPILQYDLDNNFIKEWSSVTETVNTLNLNQGNIVSCCKGIRNKTGNFKFRYKYEIIK